MDDLHDGLSAEAWRRIEYQRLIDEKFGPSGVDHEAEERAMAAREKLGYDPVTTIDLWAADAPASVPWSRRGDPMKCGGKLLREWDREEDGWDDEDQDRVPVYLRLDTWRRAFAKASELDGTARHVLHVLHMDMEHLRDGHVRGCWLAVDEIADRIDRSRATVYRALAEAEREGWIGRVPLHADDDPRHRMGTLYVPSVPDDVRSVGPRHAHLRQQH